MRTRDATVEDVPAVLGLVVSMQAECTWARVPIDEVRAQVEIERCVGAEEHLVRVATDESGRVRGALMGYLASPWWADRGAWVAFDRGIFVERDFRASGAGFVLLTDFIDWAMPVAVQIRVGITTGADERLQRMYARCGFVPQGETYLMEGRGDVRRR